MAQNRSSCSIDEIYSTPLELQVHSQSSMDALTMVLSGLEADVSLTRCNIPLHPAFLIPSQPDHCPAVTPLLTPDPLTPPFCDRPPDCG